MPHVDVPGARLYYETDGHAADEPLLLIHAGIATLRMWDPIVAALASSHYVVRYDARGHGETTCGPDDFSDRGDARALLDHLGVLRATVIGASRGGRIALDMAVETPDRVAGVVTIGSGPSGFPEVELTDAEEELCSQLDAAWEAKDHERIADLEVKLWSIGPLRNENDLDEDFVRTAFQLNRFNLKHHQDAIGESLELEPPAYDQLVDLDIPALVTVGEFDITRALIQFEYLAATIPGANRHIFSDTAHLPSVEHPAEFLEVVRPWLTEHRL